MSDSWKRAAPVLGSAGLETTVLRPHLPPAPGPGEAPTWPTVPQEALPPELAPGRTLAGRYTVLGFLGQGGMGLVLAAYDPRLDRRVALKLLRPRRSGSTGSGDERARLAREAQSMARLSHPNAVAVYDSGTLEDGSLFIAMEYVEGQTLRHWRARQPPPPWRQVLKAYLEAGRGLAAAHAAGLIHRDFKPDNVLMGQDGRARVTDFGLARVRPMVAVPGDAAPEPGSQPLPADTGSAPEGELTAAGSLVGTPRYMAPELLRPGHTADVRTDVFSFCAALYEALYGQLPFLGRTIGELLRAHAEGKVPTPPASSEVPAWVARTVLRGLRADPSERPASLEELLAALENDPEVKRRARRRTVALASVAVALGVLAGWGWVGQQTQAPACSQLGQRLTGIWDAPTKSRVRQALLSTGVPYAADTYQRVAGLLDGYASTWVRMRTEVCEAESPTQAGPRSTLAVLQESCLERRRSRLRALTELLASGPDPALVGQAVQAAQALPMLEYCADAQALTAAVPPPEDPVLRARVEALQEQVDRLEALYEAAKYPAGIALGEALLKEAEALPYPPLKARVLYVLSELKEPGGAYEEAKALAQRALLVAAQGKDSQLVARAWSQLLFILGSRQGRYEEAIKLSLALETAVALADDPLTRADADNTLGNALQYLDRFEESRQHHERALKIREKLLGPEHPHTTLSLSNLGRALLGLGRYEEARQANARALALREKSLGPEHPANAFSLVNLGHALFALGRYEEAQKNYERARALREQAFGPEDPLLDSILAGLGKTLEALGHPEEAERVLERGLALREKALGPENPFVALILNPLGAVLREQGQLDEARQRHERALAVQEKALGPHHPRLAASLLGLGELQLAAGRPAQALPLLERALTLASVEDRADVQLALARTLAEAGKDLPRARSLAIQAQEYWRGLDHQPGLTRATAWLTAHPSP